MCSSAGKTLLRNVIRHTDTHNRMVEESEMWRLKEKQMSNQHDDRDSGRVQYGRGDNSYSHNRRAHMDDMETEKSTYWMREFDKAERQDPDRWGHGGYKELYPEDFKSDHSDNEEDKKRKKRKMKKEKKVKKRKKHKSADRDIVNDIKSSPNKLRKKHKRKSGRHDRSSKVNSGRKVEVHKRKREVKMRSHRSESELSDDGDNGCHGSDKHMKTKRTKRKRFERNVSESQGKSVVSSSSDSD